ncbi:MAG: chromosomal replication initiator protein DnaA [Acidobacteria bacterium]|nr:chromosomal replication initiator protein DnaA [Acidobacteriota bacterium]
MPNSEAEEIWGAVSSVLSAQLQPGTWRSLFEDVRIDGLVDDTLTITVPSQVARSRIERKFAGLIEDALEDQGHPEIQVVVEVEIEDAAHDSVELDTEMSSTNDATTSEANQVDQIIAGGGNKNLPNNQLTFDSFVTGPSNRFAHAAALSVAETPARSYNPLFIYGQAGLGKTHLLQAIAHYIRQNYPGYVIRYISTETLLNEFLVAIRNNTQQEFKQRYREIDVLLVDDIQFIEGKEQLQEEFFHTFNTLHGDQRQIVLSSDRPPDAIATLEDRLRSRFKWGLITDIQPPDFETRLAILQKKGEQSGSTAPPEVLDFIATNITYNIRELEGALIRVNAFATLNDTELTVDLAREILADTIASTKPRKVTPGLILNETASMFGLTVEQLTSKSRTRDLVHARQIGMYVCREMTDLSYPQIAKEFGGRDHTTVIHAYEKVSTRMKDKHKTYEDVTSLIQTILATS